MLEIHTHTHREYGEQCIHTHTHPKGQEKH